MTSPVVSGAVDFDVATIISGTMSIGARTTFSKLVEATAITTTNKGASLYIRECDSSIGQYTNKYNNNILELVGSNPKDCHINIEYITIASNGVITLSVINCTLENNGGLIDNSIYANAVSVYLDYAVWQVDNRSYGSICFSYAKPSWTIDMRQSCIKASNANIFNCASSAYLQTLQYQDDQYWNGECQQYCMGGGGYEDPCISGTRYVDTYTSYPY